MSKQNQIDDYLTHGIKVIGSYEYYLLVGPLGGCYIEQVKDDDSTILFVKMPDTAGETFEDVADAITAFWAAPETHVYKFLFQC